MPTLHVARRQRQPTLVVLATVTHDPWATLVGTEFLQKKDQPIAGNHNHFVIIFLPILILVRERVKQESVLNILWVGGVGVAMEYHEGD